MFYSAALYGEEVCKEWEIKLPKGIKPERAFFDTYVSDNLIIVGEGGNGIFIYGIEGKKVRQIYYSRVVSSSVKQVSQNSIQFEPFYNRGIIREIDIYSPSKMAKSLVKKEDCIQKNGKVYCVIDGKEREIAPFLGEVETYGFSEESSLLLFANRYSGGYVYGTKTNELAKLGFGTDFRFVNKYDIIFANNSKIGESCTDAYIFYWHNQAIETFTLHREKDVCIRYPDANKESLIFIKDYKIYKCPLNLMDAVLSK